MYDTVTKKMMWFINNMCGGVMRMTYFVMSLGLSFLIVQKMSLLIDLSGFIIGLSFVIMSFGISLLLLRLYLHYDESKYSHSYITNQTAKRMAYVAVEFLELIKKMYQIGGVVNIVPSLLRVKLGMKHASHTSNDSTSTNNSRTDRIVNIRRTIRAMAKLHDKSGASDKVEKTEPDTIDLHDIVTPDVVYKTSDVDGDGDNDNKDFKHEHTCIDKNTVDEIPTNIPDFDLVH